MDVWKNIPEKVNSQGKSLEKKLEEQQSSRSRKPRRWEVGDVVREAGAQVIV